MSHSVILRPPAQSELITLDNDDDEIIEIVSEAVQRKQQSKPQKCSGFVLDIPNGQSPYTIYPYGLHSLYRLPWNPYVDANNVIKLYAHGCHETHTSPSGQTTCPPCASLKDNNNLKGIIARMKEGIAANTPYLYHGISGLTKLLQQKSQRIEAQHLHGLNQARTLVVRATALDNHKRFLVAMSSGELSCVHRLVRIALAQKKGIRAILDLLDRAAEGHV